MTTEPQRYVRSHVDLLDLWRSLMGPWGFDMTNLWVVFIHDDGLVAPTIMPIDEIPTVPGDSADAIADVLSDALEAQDAATCAFLLSRPGPGQVTESDRAWAEVLLASPDPRLTRWPVHLATRDQVRMLAPDDLLRTA